MKDNQNTQVPKRHRIYLKASRTWVEVSEEYYRDHMRYYDAFRKRKYSHGQCVCPKNKYWLCDGDCCNCEFRKAGDMISLDHLEESDDGEDCSTFDAMTGATPSIEGALCDRIELERLFERLNELMPEARQIGQLRQKGLSDEAIARVIGIKRTTFLSRLKKVKAQLAAEYPDLF